MRCRAPGGLLPVASKWVGFGQVGEPRSVAVVSSAALSELIESITVDAHGSEEQLTALLTAFCEEVRVPCSATVLDNPVDVLVFDAEGDERRGLVARCAREGRRTGVVSLVDVRFEPGSVAAWLHAAYRSWLGFAPFSARRPAGWSWPER